MRYTVFSLSTCAGFCLFRKYDSGRMLYKDVGSALFCRQKAQSKPYNVFYTPLKANMEPQNTPLKKQKHFQTTNFLGFQPLIFGGVSSQDMTVLGRVICRFSWLHVAGVIFHGTHLVGIKQCKYMMILKDFPAYTVLFELVI